MDRPLVSVCVVNRDACALLRDCLRSLRPRRQGMRLEVLVVDNASTDGSADMVAREFPRAHLIRNARNQGFARANNQAARVARGRYLFFLNNDTLVPAGAIRRLVRYARAHPEAGLIGPRLCDDRGRTQTSGRLRPTVGALLHRTRLFRWTGLFRAAYRRYRWRDGPALETRQVEVLMGAALLVRREVFFRCGGWDENYTFGGEDIDLCARVGRSHAVVYHPHVSITHYGRVSSRRHPSYAHTHTVIGITRYLRAAGTSGAALLLYKVAVTVDAPLQLVQHACQCLWRWGMGKKDKAEKSWLLFQAVGWFLVRGLVPFWGI